MRIHWSEDRNWPEALPTAGTLELTVAPVEPPPLQPRRPMTADTFHFMWEDVVHRDTPKEWIRKYIDLLGEHLWFTCDQVRLRPRRASRKSRTDQARPSARDPREGAPSRSARPEERPPPRPKEHTRSFPRQVRKADGPGGARWHGGLWAADARQRGGGAPACNYNIPLGG